MADELLESGHGTRFIFSANPGILIKEKTTKPPGIDGGDANDVTTHHNSTVRTKAPRKLRDVTDATCTVAYSPAALPQILGMINQNQQITVQFNDTSSWTFWGWLKSFEPSDQDEDGDQPTAEMTIIVSNRNAAKAETLPSYSATGGLTTTTSTTLTTTTAAP